MIISVQVSDFRNNMSMYLGKLEGGNVVDIKKGNEYFARISKHPKVKTKDKSHNNDKFMRDMEKIWLMQSKSIKKTDYSMRIDEILYGKK